MAPTPAAIHVLAVHAMEEQALPMGVQVRSGKLRGRPLKPRKRGLPCERPYERTHERTRGSTRERTHKRTRGRRPWKKNIIEIHFSRPYYSILIVRICDILILRKCTLQAIII